MCASFLIKCVLLIVGGCSLAACSGGKRYYESVGSIFHTRYSIKYEADEAKDSLILAELERFDLSLNPFNPNSVIAKVNRKALTTSLALRSSTFGGLASAGWIA